MRYTTILVRLQSYEAAQERVSLKLHGDPKIYNGMISLSPHPNQANRYRYDLDCGATSIGGWVEAIEWVKRAN